MRVGRTKEHDIDKSRAIFGPSTYVAQKSQGGRARGPGREPGEARKKYFPQRVPAALYCKKQRERINGSPLQ